MIAIAMVVQVLLEKAAMKELKVGVGTAQKIKCAITELMEVVIPGAVS
jgi:hypothetical protein